MIGKQLQHHFLIFYILILLFFFHEIFSIDAKLISKIFVVISAAAVVAILFEIIQTWFRKFLISVVVALVFGFSFSFWRSAEIVEVYTFYLIWIALYFLYLIKFWKSNESKFLIYASIIYGLSFWCHILSITIFPGFLLLLYFSKTNLKNQVLSLAIVVIFIAGMFVLNNLQGLPLNSVYSSGNFNWVGNSFAKSYLQYSKDFLISTLYFFYNFNIFVFIAIYGAYQLFYFDRKLFWILLISAMGNFGFATIYAITDNYVFFLPFNVIASLLIGFGIYKLSKQKTKWLLFSSFFIFLFYWLSFTIVSKTEKGKAFDAETSFKGGLRYYLIPWMNNNVGVIEITVEKKAIPEKAVWMRDIADEYIKILKSKKFSEDEIKNY